MDLQLDNSVWTKQTLVVAEKLPDIYSRLEAWLMYRAGTNFLLFRIAIACQRCPGLSSIHPNRSGEQHQAIWPHYNKATQILENTRRLLRYASRLA